MEIYTRITKKIQEAEEEKIRLTKQALYYQGYIHGLKRALKVVSEEFQKENGSVEFDD